MVGIARCYARQPRQKRRLRERDDADDLLVRNFERLHIQHAAVRVQHRFLHHLGQRGVREDRVHQFFFGGLQIHRNHIALDQFGHFGADHVRAEQLAGFLVEDHLDQTLVFAERNRLAVADERETADTDFVTAFLGLRFGQADGRDLRLAISAARDQVLLHRMRMQALDRLDTDHAFMLRLVRQHRRACNVADGIDAGHIGLAMTVDHHTAAVGLDAELLQPEALDVADHADGGDHPLDLDGLRLALAIVERRHHAVGLFLKLGHLGAAEDLDALLLERLAGERRDLGVLDRQHLRQHLDHRHLRTHGAVERRELDADRAGADHQQRLRHLLRHHRLEIGPDQLLVRLKAREHPRPRAGGQDDVLGLIAAGAKRPLRRLDTGHLHRELAGGIDHSLAPDHGDLVLLHQEADAVIHALGDAARALHHGLGIVGDVVGRQPVVLGMLHVMVDFRGAQQRLGGNAAPVQADAAEMLLLDDRGLEAELGRANGRDIATGPRADDDDVEGCISHCVDLFGVDLEGLRLR